MKFVRCLTFTIYLCDPWDLKNPRGFFGDNKIWVEKDIQWSSKGPIIIYRYYKHLLGTSVGANVDS